MVKKYFWVDFFCKLLKFEFLKFQKFQDKEFLNELGDHQIFRKIEDIS